MSVFSLCSQCLSGEALNHRLPENHGLPNEPSSIFGQCAGRMKRASTAIRPPEPGLR